MDESRAPRRAARLAPLLAAAIALLATSAHGQSAPQRLDDASRVRAATRDLFLRVEVQTPSNTTSHRVRVRELGLDLLDGGAMPAWNAAAGELSVAWRLLAASVSHGTLDTLARALGSEPPTGPGVWETAVDGDNRIPVVVLRNDRLELAMEPGTHRLRALRWDIDGVRWSTELVAYDVAPDGWLPSRVRVRRDGAVVLEAFVRASAPSLDELPVAATTTTEVAPSEPTPRLPALPRIPL